MSNGVITGETFMKIRAWFLVIFVCCSISSDQFIKPPLDRRYDQICWLSTHNAYAAQRYGYVYANQYYTIQEQLDWGVRAFELDTYKRCWKKKFGIIGNGGCAVSMCHGDCNQVNKWIYKPYKPGNDALGFANDGLKIFKQFLEKNPQEIITLTLENYVTEPGLLDKQFEDAGITALILKPEDWNPIEKQGWPTLQWMVTNNKRLVVFNERTAADHTYTSNSTVAATKYTYYQWASMAQNQWAGAKNEMIALKERDASVQNRNIPRYLFELDWFANGGKILGGGISNLATKIAKLFKKETPFVGDYARLNSQGLQNFLDKVLQRGLETGIAKGRYPNFIKVDFFHEGNPMSLVNKINKMANDPVMREKMFGLIK